MIGRTVCLAAGLILLSVAPSATAGYYTSIDMPEEIRWSRDYKGVFEEVLIKLGTIGANDLKFGGDSPMRHRYLLIETLGRDGTAHLKTLEQKLNYSAVLIRRGKAYEATQVLQPLSTDKEHAKNFLVWSHLATANFLSGNPDFRAKAPLQLEQALSLWPTRMEDVDPALQKFLKLATLSSDEELDRFRTIETYLQKLMRYRVRQDRLAKMKKPTDDGFDPIFIDVDSKENIRPPVRFLSEDGKFEVGRIAPAEKKKLPRDAVEIVEQLLIWMPTDQRLSWLLAEVLNASAMDAAAGDERNDMIRSAYKAFKKLDPFENPPSFAPQVRPKIAALGAAVEKLPPPRMLNPRDFGLDKDKDPDSTLTDTDWWRALAVGFTTGLAIGMFAIWQIQEMRRRRQARSA